MTRVAKLYARAVADPRGLLFAEFERLLRAFGFEQLRAKSSHRHYKHPAVPRLLTDLSDGKQVKGYLVRELLDMVDEVGLDMSK